MSVKKKKKKSNWKQIFMLVPFLLLGGVCGIVISRFLFVSEPEDLGQMLFSCAALLVGMYVGMFLQIAIHEAGHLVFGLISGYQFSSYRIGSLMWLNENGKIRFCRYSLAGTGGQCLMIPPDMVDGSFPTVLYNLGGCIGNVIAGGLFWGLYILLGGDSPVAVVFLMTAIVGFGFALINGIPMNSGSVANDGYNALSLGKNPTELRSIWLQLKINEQIARGIRLKDMPEEWFAVPTDEEMKDGLTSAVGVLCCNRLVDQHRFSEAEELMKHLSEMESGMLSIHRDMVSCDRITCCLLEGKQDEILNRMEEKDFVKFRKSMKTTPATHRTEYVYALLKEKNEEKAAKALENFEKCAKRYPYPSEAQADRELMELARIKGEETVC